MERVILYKDVKILIQNILKMEKYEEILMNTINDIAKKKRKAKDTSVQDFQIKTLIDVLRECEIEEDQKPIINMIIGRLEVS